jgi:hypothetical protein
MKNHMAFFTALAFVAATPAFAQRPAERPAERAPQQREPNAPRANQGRVPSAPEHRAPRAAPEPERRDGGRINNVPHVNHDKWYGHDRPDDKRFHQDHPFEHGRFERLGPSNRYRIERFDRDHRRFWLPGGFYFQIAPWDWDLAADWCWDCGDDDYVVYDDPDHEGWYLLYNVHTGHYIHVQYMGS